MTTDLALFRRPRPPIAASQLVVSGQGQRVVAVTCEQRIRLGVDTTDLHGHGTGADLRSAVGAP